MALQVKQIHFKPLKLAICFGRSIEFVQAGRLHHERRCRASRGVPAGRRRYKEHWPRF